MWSCTRGPAAETSALGVMAGALLGNLLSDVALHELALELRERALDVRARQRRGAHHAHAQAAHERAQQPAARLGLGRAYRQYELGIRD